jgi:hypothetical protein
MAQFIHLFDEPVGRIKRGDIRVAKSKWRKVTRSAGEWLLEITCRICLPCYLATLVSG